MQPSEQATTIDSVTTDATVPASCAWLTIVDTPDPLQLNRRVLLAKEKHLEIGRNVPGGWTIHDGRLSRMHCRVAWDARQRTYRLGDADSKNGTFLNGRRSTLSVLNSGDVLRLGDTLFVYQHDDAMATTRESAQRAAVSRAAVLLLGDTGVGKEVLARSIHEQSGRTGPFIAVNCGALSQELAMSELFGHVKGAFSGAQHARQGLFAAAAGGTIFLDEIGDMPTDLQPALLRVVQEKAIRPVGNDREQPIDVRIVSATNVDLAQAVGRGQFRDDLLARLAQITLRLPNLSQRKAELLTLFCDISQREQQTAKLTPDAAEALLLWNWPLNFRELESLARSLILLENARSIDLQALQRVKPQVAQLFARRRAEDAASALPSGQNPLSNRELMLNALERHGGNISRVALELQTTRAQVYRWMKRLGLETKSSAPNDS